MALPESCQNLEVTAAQTCGLVDLGLSLVKLDFLSASICLSEFSLRILVAGERCNFTGEYCERGSMSQYKIVIGYRTLAGEFCVVNGEFSNL